VLGQLKRRFPLVRRNLEVIHAALDLAVFVFMIASVVYVSQRGVNPKVEDFIDALYFTVATLSTTGFGDVTLIGSTSGELLSILMMLVGITLFLRLAQAVFRPGGKVVHPCPQCGLQRHEQDAVHCKACGHVLNIPNDNDRGTVAADPPSSATDPAIDGTRNLAVRCRLFIGSVTRTETELARCYGHDG
jgi:voltage-gated potassium channel